MADVLANLNSGNLEEVPDTGAALQAGTHGIPLYNPQGEPHVATDMNEASTLMGQGYTQPTPEQLQGGLNHAKVNTPGEKIGSFLEGAGEGGGAMYTGPVPVVQGAEAGIGKLFGIKELSPEYINLRHKYNQAEEMAGNAAGVVGVNLFGGAELAEPFTLPALANAAVAKGFGASLSPLGSLAAKSAVQGALFSSNQELGKFLYDPSQTAEKAIANVTLNTALSGAAGAAIGSVPALWNRTGDAVNASKFLQGLKEQINVTPSGQNIPDMLTQAGVGASAETKAAMSGVGPLRNMAADMAQEREASTYAGRIVKGGIDGLKQDIHDQTLVGLGATPEDLPAIQAAGDNEAASPIRQAIVQKAQTLHNAQSQAWEAVDPKLQGAVVPPEAKASFADSVSAIQGQYAKTPETSPEYGLIGKISGDLPNLETLQDYQKWSSRALQKLWGSPNNHVADYPEAYFQLHDAVRDWTDKFKLSALSSMDPQAVPLLQQAQASSRQMYQWMRGASQALKIGQPGGNPAQWIQKLNDPLQLTDGQLLNKATPADNKAFLDWVQGSAPEAAPALQNAYRQKLIQAASNNVNNEFRPQNAWKILNNQWGPETQQFVLPEGGLQKLAALQDTMEALPSGHSPSGPFIENMLKSWSGGLGAVIGHVTGVGGPAGYVLGKLGGMLGTEVPDAVRLGILRYAEKGVVDVPAFKAMTDYFGHAVNGDALMTTAINGIVNSKLSDAIAKKIAPDQKGAKQLGGTMDKYAKDQGSMFGIGGNLGTYLPEHQIAVAGVAGRAQEYLQQLKPDTTPLGPLDSPKVTSQADQAKYDRALNLVNKPLSILHHIQKGNLTQDDMAVMDLYPGLRDTMRQKFMDGITDMKNKGKTIPYQQRLALSNFLGMNLDSTIGPMTMMTLLNQKGQQPSPGGKPGGKGGAKKPPQSAYSKMAEGAQSEMTMNQKAEHDRIGQQ